MYHRGYRITLLGLAIGFMPVFAIAQNSAWKKVEDAMNGGTPQTAIRELEPILKAALEKKQWDEAVRAVCRKIQAEAMIQGGEPHEKIIRLEKAFETLPAEMHPVLRCILAEWYWEYFQNNQWRFMQRTESKAPSGDDLLTWDLSRVIQEIDAQFSAALANAETLKKIPVSDYAGVLEKGSMPDSYRPTLYDIIAHAALDFYESGEQAANVEENPFEIQADSPIFARREDFLAWDPVSANPKAMHRRAIQLYQELMRFHAADEDKSALLDVDIDRIAFALSQGVGEEKTVRYIQGLERISSGNPNHELASAADAMIARKWHEEGDFVTAREIAKRGESRFPDSIGGKLCHNLIVEIEAPEWNVTAEAVWNEPFAPCRVQYRNIRKLHFRIVPYDFVRWTKNGNQEDPRFGDEQKRLAFLKRKPLLAWSSDLPATEDYQMRDGEVAIPQSVPAGSYYLIASGNDGFTAENNHVSFTPFWVSRLSIVTRSPSRSRKASVDGFILDAVSGEPVSGAKVKLYSQNSRAVYTPVGEATSDANGAFALGSVNKDQRDYNGYILHASHPTGSVATDHFNAVPDWQGFNGPGQRNQPFERTILFTDRVLYRPGQTIQYKGICIAADQKEDAYWTLRSRNFTLAFLDQNGQEIASRVQTTNEFGSFSGTFTAPSGKNLGSMQLVIREGATGATQISVEEYKRPKFQVKLDASDTAPKLDAPVTVSGHATSYTGAPIDNAKVTYRVTREARFAPWICWIFGRCFPPGEPQEIAHGETTTDQQGKFQIEFNAVPDRSIPKSDDPRFQFVVTADVTDGTGETRFATRQYTIAYTALAAELDAKEWQTADQPVALEVTTRSHDGEGESASGTLQVLRLVEPNKVIRKRLENSAPMERPTRRIRNGNGGLSLLPPEPPTPDPSDPNSWELGESVLEKAIETDDAGLQKLELTLPVGVYRAKLEVRDRFGNLCPAERIIRVIDLEAQKLAIKIPDLLIAPEWSAKPGEEFKAIAGSGYEESRAFIEVEHRNRVVKSFWTEPGVTQVLITVPVEESMRGGFFVRVTRVRENRAYLHQEKVEVPWTNKELTIRWEHFVSKLEPGSREKWTAVITGPNAEKAVAEMVATLYDASLDQFQEHQWPHAFDVFRNEQSPVQSQFTNHIQYLQQLIGNERRDILEVEETYRRIRDELIERNHFPFSRRRAGMMFAGGMGGMGGMAAESMMDGAVMAPMAKATLREGTAMAADFSAETAAPAAADRKTAVVTPRKNLQETAFFFPHLVSNKDGEVRIEFQMPEALTEWKFFGFAHDNDLRSALLTDTTVSAKDLMVQPNPPRFLREGDELAFTAKVSNQSPTQQTGKIRLKLFDARTDESIESRFGIDPLEQEFQIPSHESRTVAWRLRVPDGAGVIRFEVVGATERLSDGEEGLLPILSRRTLVTESMSLPIRGPATKTYDFKRLAESRNSDTLKHQSLEIQVASNPAWYAVQSLPYLMEYPYGCSEQTFNKLYANALARHIAKSDPKIERIFEQWRAMPALKSPLSKNQELKEVLIEETPWLRDAERANQALQNVGLFFDDNRINQELERMLEKLKQQQLAEGAWPWFPGGRENRFITQYIVAGFGRLGHIGIELDQSMPQLAVAYLDREMEKERQEILRRKDAKEANYLSEYHALYLYARSFYLAEMPIDGDSRPMIDFWLKAAREGWPKLSSRLSQAHVALALHRFGDQATAKAIVNSFKERSVSDEEMGMHWRDRERSWWWYHAPIESQAMMIEAFDEIAGDQESVAACQVWLLKQKQTQNWESTKATADAVYSLLGRGAPLLASNALVTATVGEETISPEQLEAGTGYYEYRWTRGEIDPAQSRITLAKTEPGVAWGSIHWQYLEDLSKVTAFDANALKVEKTLMVKRNSSSGPVLEPVDERIAVGDELVVRIVLRTDRDMEYVHLKDQRGSGVEPTDVLSGYRFREGLAYYQSTRDTATHFFIDYLPRGTYVFEYSARVQHRGRYQSGIATLQCMYAPEFNSHSESVWLEVK